MSTRCVGQQDVTSFLPNQRTMPSLTVSPLAQRRLTWTKNGHRSGRILSSPAVQRPQRSAKPSRVRCPSERTRASSTAESATEALYENVVDTRIPVTVRLPQSQPLERGVRVDVVGHYRFFGIGKGCLSRSVMGHIISYRACCADDVVEPYSNRRARQTYCRDRERGAH